MSEDHLRERAESAEARNSTLREQNDHLKEKVRQVQETLCARERGDGSFVIDYQAFIERLGVEQALVLRGYIDATYNVSGAPGEKPRVRLPA